jgi:hypothetical protein
MSDRLDDLRGVAQCQDDVAWAVKEIEKLRAIQKAAERVVRCTTAEAAYKRHDALIEALDAAEAAKEPGDAS